jgi:hypothetical protein
MLSVASITALISSIANPVAGTQIMIRTLGPERQIDALATDNHGVIIVLISAASNFPDIYA